MSGREEQQKPHGGVHVLQCLRSPQQSPCLSPSCPPPNRGAAPPHHHHQATLTNRPLGNSYLAQAVAKSFSMDVRRVGRHQVARPDGPRGVLLKQPGNFPPGRALPSQHWLGSMLPGRHDPDPTASAVWCGVFLPLGQARRL